MKKLDRHEAVLLTEELENWVSETFKESARGCRNTLKWYTNELYSEGYCIVKNEKE